MKRFTLPSIVLILSCTLITKNAQSQNCVSSTAQTDLNINNVRARLLAGGDMWWDFSEGRYIVPEPGPGSVEVSAMYAAGLWMGGYDTNGNLRTAAQTYRQIGNDYWSGPIAEDGTTDQQSCQRWDRHWKINRTDILAHINDYEDNGQIDDAIPNSILGWPARGNANFADVHGFPLPNQELAPFVDINANGVYDSTEGDYPDIKGDQAVWWMFNDVGNQHGQTGSFQMGIQVGAMAYAFNASISSPLYNTTFYDYTITNRGGETYTDYYIGLFADVDLGCYNNDYLGCDPDRDMGFAYNGTINDPNCNGVNGYQDEIPLLGIKILKGLTGDNGEQHGMSTFMGFFDSSAGAPLSWPQEPADYYGYMTGYWTDGSPLEYGGNGHQENTTQTSYLYPSNPSDNSSGSWSEVKINNSPGDRRIIISTGPTTLAPDEVQSVSFGVAWVPDVPHPAPDIAPLQAAVDEITDFYNQLVAVDSPNIISDAVEFIPNPMTEYTRLTVKGNLKANNISIYNIDGRLMRTYDKIIDNELIINREELPTGVYIYKANFENGQISGGKLLVK